MTNSQLLVETYATQKQFHDKVGKLVETLIEMGNPFEEESTDLYAIDTKDVVDCSVADSLQKLAVSGGQPDMQGVNNVEHSS